MTRWDRIEGYVLNYGPAITVAIAAVCLVVMVATHIGRAL